MKLAADGVVLVHEDTILVIRTVPELTLRDLILSPRANKAGDKTGIFHRIHFNVRQPPVVTGLANSEAVRRLCAVTLGAFGDPFEGSR